VRRGVDGAARLLSDTVSRPRRKDLLVSARRLFRRGAPVAVAAIALVIASAGSASPAAGPTEIASPAISGVAVVGKAVTGSAGSWSGTQPITFAYQWLQCKADAGDDSSTSSCRTISGATTTSYTVSNNDLGMRLRFRVTASNKQGKTTSTSAATSVVTTESGKPANSSAPSISGVAAVGYTLTAATGKWVGEQPITYSYKWLRCDKDGNACKATGKTAKTYKVVDADAGKRMRLQVIAKNSRGNGDAFSTATDVVAAAPGGGIIDLPNGGKSVDAKDIPKDQRLVVEKVIFDPNPVRSRSQPIVTSIQVRDTRGYFVRNATVFVRSTPRVTEGGDEKLTAVDGWVTYSLMPLNTFPLKNNANVQFYAKAYRPGDPSLGGIYGSRLVQVATKAP